MNFLPLTSILLATLIINGAIRRSNRFDKEKRRRYLEREEKASRTPSQNLDKIRWIKIPDSLPLDIMPEDPKASKISESIHNLSLKKITNLSGFTNTDLKLEYGAVNLKELSAADSNCIVLLRNISSLAEIYIKNDHYDEAMQLLQFAVEAGSDDPKQFEALSSYYLEDENYDAIYKLKETADKLDSERADSIRDRLSQTLLLMECVDNEQTSEGNP